MYTKRSFTADERVLEAVAQTNTLSADHFEELCQLAVRLFAADKQSKRRLTRTASASGWEVDNMEQVVLAVAKILMDSARAGMTAYAFRLHLKGMTMSEQHIEVFAHLYEVHMENIRKIVSRRSGSSIPHYLNLEWRVDLELGTRFQRYNPKPLVTLRLDTATQASSCVKPQVQTTCFRVDYDGLKLLQRQLENALKEVDSVHCSRIQRYMQ